jgi:hypothetical protein
MKKNVGGIILLGRKARCAVCLANAERRRHTRGCSANASASSSQPIPHATDVNSVNWSVDPSWVRNSVLGQLPPSPRSHTRSVRGPSRLTLIRGFSLVRLLMRILRYRLTRCIRRCSLFLCRLLFCLVGRSCILNRRLLHQMAVLRPFIWTSFTRPVPGIHSVCLLIKVSTLILRPRNKRLFKIVMAPIRRRICRTKILSRLLRKSLCWKSTSLPSQPVHPDKLNRNTT